MFCMVRVTRRIQLQTHTFHFKHLRRYCRSILNWIVYMKIFNFEEITFFDLVYEKQMRLLSGGM